MKILNEHLQHQTFRVNNILPKTIFLGLIFMIFFIGCFPDNKNISYDDEKIVEESNILEDSSYMKSINMPIHFDSVEYIIFPLTFVKNAERKSLKRGSYNYESWGYYSASEGYNREVSDGYVGDFYNLIFQNTKTDEIKYLTNDRIIGNKFRYLREVYQKTGKKYIVLEIRDKDTNKDGEIDNQDIISLYICEISGSKLQKLSPENQNLLGWKIDNQLNKLYFQTRKDINKDGVFDTKDSTLLYFVNLSKNIKTSKINFKH